MSENEIEPPKKCYIVIGTDPLGKKVICNKPVRYEGSFVCEDHVWNHYDGKKHRKLTIPQMQEQLLAMRSRKN